MSEFRSEVTLALRRLSSTQVVQIVRGLGGTAVPMPSPPEAAKEALRSGLFEGVAGDLIDMLFRPWRFSTLALVAGAPYDECTVDDIR